MIVVAFAPLVLAPLSEVYGRNLIYVSSEPFLFLFLGELHSPLFLNFPFLARHHLPECGSFHSSSRLSKYGWNHSFKSLRSFLSLFPSFESRVP